MIQADQTTDLGRGILPSSRSSEIGGRVRELRLSANLTQSELAADRFSKEYISQIERGKTRPTPETLTWLAARLGADRAFLEAGVSGDTRSRVEASLSRAAALIETHRYSDALDVLDELGSTLPSTGASDLELRLLSTEARARVYLGDINTAVELLSGARALTEQPAFTDVDRGEVLFQLGVCRCKLSSLSSAIALFDEALRLVESSPFPADRLRSSILYWRARCFRHQRDYVAARDDVERALEISQASADTRTLAHSYFQASLIAERQGHWIQARAYAERAKIGYEQVSDQESLAKLMNNLGGLTFLLGKPAEAVSHLKDSFRLSIEVGSTADAGQAASSLAHIALETGEAQVAEKQALEALRLLDDRVDFLNQIGSAQLVLGRSLVEQGRLDEAEPALAAADRTFERFASLSHRAGVWIAQGDLASRRGDDVSAARLYRRSAEALQDVRF